VTGYVLPVLASDLLENDAVDELRSPLHLCQFLMCPSAGLCSFASGLLVGSAPPDVSVIALADVCRRLHDVAYACLHLRLDLQWAVIAHDDQDCAARFAVLLCSGGLLLG